ncbi:MAG: hypothetical protein ACFFDS_02700 [Candidatus Thorarchaeota archaeon]
MKDLRLKDGWIKIYRSLFNKGFYVKSEYVHLWIHLLMKANHEAREMYCDGRSVIIPRGQLLTSRNSLSKETGIHESKIQRILKFFESEQQIEQQTTNRYRLITIKNYHFYQKHEQQNEQVLNNSRPTSEHKQEFKNYKNDKKHTFAQNEFELKFQKFWDLYPRKLNKQQARKIFLKLMIKGVDPQTIMRGLQGYIDYFIDNCKEKREDPNAIYLKYPTSFLRDECYLEFLNYEKAGPPL